MASEACDPVVPPQPAETLSSLANRVLKAASATAKTSASEQAVQAWRSGNNLEIGRLTPPRRPGRPNLPILRPPREMPKRGRAGSLNNRIALIHAIAHIEFNAIDLAWDLVARFTRAQLPRRFYDEWVGVAADETRHFLALQNRLQDLGSSYGALPAHDGLWEAAAKTRDDLLSRLAVVPLVLEARGLDVTPTMIERLRAVGDNETADILATSLDDEINHVAIGHFWFVFVCKRFDLTPRSEFHDRVKSCGIDSLKGPFNNIARDAAGLPRNYYCSLASE